MLVQLPRGTKYLTENQMGGSETFMQYNTTQEIYLPTVHAEYDRHCPKYLNVLADFDKCANHFMAEEFATV